jgi:hypothetical protein
MPVAPLRAALLGVLLLFGLSAGAALAQPTQPVTGPPSPQRTAGPQLGVLPPRAEAGHGDCCPGFAGNNLSYHGGPALTAGNTVYAIYWVPPGYTVDANYEALIKRFFTDVAADSASGGTAKTTNVYDSDTQYYQGSSANHIQYNSTFGGAYVDSTPLPPNGCTDAYTSVCVSDTQLQNELVSLLSAGKLPAPTNAIYFVFTAKGIGSCAGNSCAFSQYCAYHSWFQDSALNNRTVLYANMPYADTVLNGATGPCDAGQHPNGDDADATLNVTSHEHNETITDQQGSAWYDHRGYEDGDKCAWNFGSVSGTAPADYNQTINGNHYFLQQEWSNRSSGCVLQGT